MSQNQPSFPEFIFGCHKNSGRLCICSSCDDKTNPNGSAPGPVWQTWTDRLVIVPLLLKIKKGHKSCLHCVPFSFPWQKSCIYMTCASPPHTVLSTFKHLPYWLTDIHKEPLLPFFNSSFFPDTTDFIFKYSDKNAHSPFLNATIKALCHACYPPAPFPLTLISLLSPTFPPLICQVPLHQEPRAAAHWLALCPGFDPFF